MTERDELELKAQVTGQSARVMQATSYKVGVLKSPQATKSADGHRAHRALRRQSQKNRNAPGRMLIINALFVIQENPSVLGWSGRI